MITTKNKIALSIKLSVLIFSISISTQVGFDYYSIAVNLI